MNAPSKTPTQLDLDNERPTPTQLRKMLVAGTEEFDAKHPQKTAEESVDNFLASRGPARVIARDEGIELGHTEPEAEFDWFTDPSVVIRHQRATAIYENASGGITIRQERDWNEDQDPVMAIASENAFVFAEAFAKHVKRS